MRNCGVPPLAEPLNGGRTLCAPTKEPKPNQAGGWGRLPLSGGGVKQSETEGVGIIRPYEVAENRKSGWMISAPAECCPAGCHLCHISNLSGGRRGEAEHRRKFFAELSFKKARAV